MGVLSGQHRVEEFLGRRVSLCRHLQGATVGRRGHLTDQPRQQGAQDVRRGRPEFLPAAARRSCCGREGQSQRVASGEAEHPVP